MTELLRYALVSPAGEILEERFFETEPPGIAVAPNKPRLVVWRTEVDDFDPATEVLEAPVDVVEEGRVVTRRLARAKTSDELTAELAAQVVNLCGKIDAERERRQQLDFTFDFGASPAFNEAGDTIAAGVRSLQMRWENQRDWQVVLQLATLAVIAGQSSQPMQIRAEDNWNILAPATQFIACYQAGAIRNAVLLFYAAGLKSLARAATSTAEIEAILAGLDGEWSLF